LLGVFLFSGVCADTSKTGTPSHNFSFADNVRKRNQKPDMVPGAEKRGAT